MSSDEPIPDGMENLPEEKIERLRGAYERALEGAGQGNKSESTLKVYENEWGKFVEWCEENNVSFLPAQPEVIITYLEDIRIEKGLVLPTLKKKTAAISHFHRKSEATNPVLSQKVSNYLAWRREEESEREKEKATPLFREDLERVLVKINDPVEDSPADAVSSVRDKAMLLIGWICGLRRSEIAQIHYHHLEHRTPEGYVLTLPKQKNEHNGKEMKKGIPRRYLTETLQESPASALDDWLEILKKRGYLENKERAIFRSIDRWGNIGEQISGRGISHALKKRFRAAGLDPEDYTPHSLRSGIANEASRCGASVSDILQVAGRTNVRGGQSDLQSRNIFENSVFENVLKE